MKFTDAEREELRAAVARAEARTSAEIVPYVVPASDTYPVAVWRGAGAGVLLGLAVCLLTFQFYAGWGLAWLFTGWGVALCILLFGMLGAMIAGLWPAAKRALTGSDRIAQMVHLRAMQAFVEEEVFATRDRTGVLVYISLLEHRVEIIADSEINRRISGEDWGDIVAKIRDGIRNDRLYEGLVEAFDLCGSLLEEKGMAIRPDDENELRDEIRGPRR